MKLILEVKNAAKAVRPSKDNLVLYDGKEWYITTKQELMKEYDEHFDTKIKQCDEKINEMNTLKRDVAKQILEINDIVKTMFGKESK